MVCIFTPAAAPLERPGPEPYRPPVTRLSQRKVKNDIEEGDASNMGVLRKKTQRGGESGTKYYCNVCNGDVTSTVRINCAHPACPDYDLCVACFGKGDSSANHEPGTHAYRVIEQNSVPIYEEAWGADEELLLLEGAETYGIGSWADIANHIGGYRTKEEVAEHYQRIYIDSSNFALPEHASPNDMALFNETPRDEFQISKKRRIETRKEEAKNAPPATPKKKPTASVPSCHEVQGYMPGRLEFETEYANDAEEAVMHMHFDPGDGLNPVTGQMDPEMELKMCIMDIYNSRLTGRLERKKIIFEHKLLEYKKNSALDKKRTKEERELLNKAKPFARMMNHNDLEEFNKGLLREHDLRQAIAQLQEWRRMGISDLRTGEKYEQEKAIRVQKMQPMGSLDRDRFAAQRKAAIAPEVPSGVAALIAPELPIRIGGAAMNGAASGFGTPNGIDSPARGTNGTITPTTTKKKDAIASLSIPPISGITPLSSLSTAAIKSSKDEVDTPWSETHLLTPQEIDLCKVLRMQPKVYLVVKEQILKEALRGDGKLRKKGIREVWPKGMEAGKGGRIWEAFVSWGWIGKG